MLLLVALVASVFTQLVQASRQLDGIRATYAESELLVTRSVLDTIEEAILDENWSAIIHVFGPLQHATRSTRLYIIQQDGEILVDSISGGLPEPTSLDFLNEAGRHGQAVRWKTDQDVLHIAIKIARGPSQNDKFLVREIALQPELLQVREVQSNLMLRTIISTLVLGSLGILIMWVLGVRPVKRMQAVAMAVSQGDMQQRVEISPLTELNDMGRAFNQMLDEIELKREELEAINSNLELTVAERTVAIEQVNHDLKQRAASMEVINQIINAASTSLNLLELADFALNRVMSAMKADFGGIIVEGDVIASSYPAAILSYLTKSTTRNVTESEVRVLVPDWKAEDLSPRLAEISHMVLIAGIRSSIHGSVRVGQRSIGRIDLASKSPNQWKKSELDLLVVIGQQMGTAIQRLKDYEESLENSRMMTRLAELAGLLNRPLDAKEVIATIGNGLIDLSGAPRVAIFQFQDSGDFFTLWSHNLPKRFLRALATHCHAEKTFFLPVNPVPDVVTNIGMLAEEKRDWWKATGMGIQSYASWPLTTNNQQDAVAVCFNDRPMQFSALQKEVLEAFTRQAATALRNARLLALEREQRSLAEALREVSAVLTSTLEFDEVIERILANLNRVLEHDGANVMMLDGETLYIVRTRGYTLAETQSKSWRNPLQRFKVMQHAYETGRAVVVPDTAHEPMWHNRPESSWIKSFATAPVSSRGRIIGFVNVSSKQTGFFTDRHGEILQAFANQASVAMENAHQFQATREQVDETSALLRALAPLLSAGGDLNTVCDAIAEAVVREFEQAHCSVILVDWEKKVANVFKEAGDFTVGIRSLPLNGPGLTVESINSGQIIYAGDVRRYPNYIHAAEGVQSELVVPMLAGGEVIGVINVESKVLDAFSERKRRLLVTFTERASWVVANAKLLKSSRTGERQMTLLNEITQVSLSGREPAVIFIEIIGRVAALVGADGAYMTRWVEETAQTIPLAAFGPYADLYTQDIPEPGERNLTFALMQEGRPIAVENVKKSTIIPPQVAAMFPIRALLGVPLQVNGAKLGAILVGFVEPHAFIPSEVGVVQQATDLIALILARMNALRQAENRAADSERLRQASAALTTTLDIEEVAGLIIQHLGALLKFDTALVTHIRGDNLVPIAHQNLPAGDDLLHSTLPVHDSFFLRMVSHDEPLLVNDVQAAEGFENWGGTQAVHSWLGLVLRAGNQVVGTVSLGRWEVRPFTDDEILMARVFSNQAGTALQNAVLHAHQQQLAITDPLTELYNRRGFFELARHEIERSRRFSRPLTFMMLDIDHFKLVNDQYGHHVGDMVLHELAGRLRDCTREVDLVGRYGGEEFCILLPESTCSGSCAASERILEAVRSHPFELSGTQVSITASIGVTTMTSSNITLEDLIQQSDEALYQAKANGRNRAEAWDAGMQQNVTDLAA